MVAHGSREHWQNGESYRPQWDTRAEQAARLIPPGSRVLDIGCGPNFALRRFLPSNSAYVPADLTPWTPDVQPVDIDANLFPDGQFDCIVLLGVIEYLQKPQNVFAYARRIARMMVVSFCHPDIGWTASRRRSVGWINDFSESEFREVAFAAGWSIQHFELYQASLGVRQNIYILRSLVT